MREKKQGRDYRRETPQRGAVGEPPLFFSRSWALLALLAIMLLGTALRFYGLGVQSLSGDELASWDFSNRETFSQLIGGVRGDEYPPLYFLILRFAQWIFGDAEWALRLPSALAGWLCILAIYLLGKRLYSEREGIMAALFLAVLWAPIYYSQEARAYSMLILLPILTSYFWWGVMLGLRYRRELPVREAALYVVCALLCAYAHYFGLLLVVLQGAALAALAYGMLREVALLYVPVALAYLPWLPSMVHQFGSGEQSGTGEPVLRFLPDYFQFLFGQSGLISLSAWTLLAFLLIRGWDDLRPRQKGRGVPPGVLLAGWALGPFVVAYVASQSTVQLLTNENLLVSLPAVYLLLARSLTRTFSGKAAAVFQGTVAASLAGAGLVYLLFSMDYYTTPTKEQFREGALYVVGHEGEDTLLVRCDTGDRLDYYLKTTETGEKNDLQACTVDDFPKIESRVKGGDYKEVLHLISQTDPDPQMVSMLQRSFQPVHYERFDGAAVVVYKVGPSVPSGLPQPESSDSFPQPKPPVSLPKDG